MRRSWVVVIVVLAMAGMAAGCGGDDESEPDTTTAWASDFCTAVTTWKDDLESIQSDFSSPSDFSEESIKSAAEDAKSATDTLLDTLRDLGAPDTASGEQVRDAVGSVSSTVEDESAKIQDAADGVSSLADLPAAISTITASVSAILTAGSEARQTVEDADVDGELRTAFENSPECDDLSSS